MRTLFDCAQCTEANSIFLNANKILRLTGVVNAILIETQTKFDRSKSTRDSMTVSVGEQYVKCILSSIKINQQKHLDHSENQ